MVAVWVVEMTWFLSAERKSLVFSVSMQIDVHVVWVFQTDVISVWGIEVDFIPV